MRQRENFIAWWVFGKQGWPSPIEGNIGERLYGSQIDTSLAHSNTHSHCCRFWIIVDYLPVLYVCVVTCHTITTECQVCIAVQKGRETTPDGASILANHRSSQGQHHDSASIVDYSRRGRISMGEIERDCQATTHDSFPRRRARARARA